MRREPTGPPPIIAALDTNHDGSISAAEIEKASTTLLTLDKNNDGELSRRELQDKLPRHGRGYELARRIRPEFPNHSAARAPQNRRPRAQEPPRRLESPPFHPDHHHRGGPPYVGEQHPSRRADHPQESHRWGPPESHPGRHLGRPPGRRTEDGHDSRPERSPTDKADIEDNADNEDQRPSEPKPDERRRERTNPFFERFDEDGDGQLSNEEIPERMQNIITEIDTNEDGVISKDEAAEAFENRMRGGRPRGGRPGGPPPFNRRPIRPESE